MIFKLVFVHLTLIVIASASPSAVDLVQDIYKTCLKELSISCVKPKSLSWLSKVSNDPVIQITENLMIVKKDAARQDVEVLNVIKSKLN